MQFSFALLNYGAQIGGTLNTVSKRLEEDAENEEEEEIVNSIRTKVRCMIVADYNNQIHTLDAIHKLLLCCQKPFALCLPSDPRAWEYRYLDFLFRQCSLRMRNVK